MPACGLQGISALPLERPSYLPSGPWTPWSTLDKSPSSGPHDSHSLSCVYVALPVIFGECYVPAATVQGENNVFSVDD